MDAVIVSFYEIFMLANPDRWMQIIQSDEVVKITNPDWWAGFVKLDQPRFFSYS